MLNHAPLKAVGDVGGIRVEVVGVTVTTILQVLLSTTFLT